MSELQLDVSKELRSQLDEDLKKLQNNELVIDMQLKEFFFNLSGSHLQVQQHQLHKKSLHIHPILTSVKKIEEFSPCFEAINQDTKKLTAQIGECRNLSEKMSKIVRRLDNMQIRSQLALTCTLDIINLKECKIKMLVAMEEHNLPLAVNYLKQYHDVDEEAAKASDDIGALQQAERELKVLVKMEFNKAIEESDIEGVMSLCPLLQTLGLETEARDTFLNFMESNIFIAVTADLESSASSNTPENSIDNSIQALSSVFNSTYLIFQNYLPIIIKGMEASYGDIHFIRRLHGRCEKQSAIVLKRYVKFRNLKQLIQSSSSANLPASGSLTKTASNYNLSNTSVSSADLHMVLDELTLLIQYCCVYAKYLAQLCHGAESRNRNPVLSAGKSFHSQHAEIDYTHADKDIINRVKQDDNGIVFVTQTDFSLMVEELVNKYYVEGEIFLMRQSVKSTLARLSELTNMSNISSRSSYSTGLDECFFVLKRCGLRALMTNSIHASCVTLRVITDLIITELYSTVSSVLNNAITKIISIIQEYTNGFVRSASSNSSIESSTADSSEEYGPTMIGSDFNSVVKVLGLKNAISLASSITINHTGNVNPATRINPADESDSDDDDQQPDVWGISKYKSLLTIAELCVRYCDQLTKEITNTGENIYGIISSGSSTTIASSITSLRQGANSNAVATRERGNTSRDSNNVPIITSESEKLKMCIEDFDSAKKLYSQVCYTLYWNALFFIDLPVLIKFYIYYSCLKVAPIRLVLW